MASSKLPPPNFSRRRAEEKETVWWPGLYDSWENGHLQSVPEKDELVMVVERNGRSKFTGQELILLMRGRCLIMALYRPKSEKVRNALLD